MCVHTYTYIDSYMIRTFLLFNVLDDNLLLFFFQLVDGEFDIENSFIIQDSQNIVHMLNLLPNCSPTLQVCYNFYTILNNSFAC